MCGARWRTEARSCSVAPMNTTTDTTTLADRIERLITQGARFELRGDEAQHRRVQALTTAGITRTFRDGGTWLELAD